MLPMEQTGRQENFSRASHRICSFHINILSYVRLFSTPVLNRTLIHPHILLCRLLPGEVLLHPPLHHLRPRLFVAEGVECAMNGIQQSRRAIAPELEAVTASVWLFVDRVI